MILDVNTLPISFVGSVPAGPSRFRPPSGTSPLSGRRGMGAAAPRRPETGSPPPARSATLAGPMEPGDRRTAWVELAGYALLLFAPYALMGVLVVSHTVKF